MRPFRTTVRASAIILGLLLMTPSPGRPERRRPFIDPHLARMMRGSLAALEKGARPGTLLREELRHYRRFLAVEAEAKEPRVHVRLRLDDQARQAIERLGLRTYGRLEGFASAFVPVHRLQEVAALPGIEGMQAVRIPEPELDISRVEVRSADLADVYTTARGQGVIVGGIDTGIDWRHGDFRNPDGTTRIKYLWSQDDECVGTPPAPPFDFGCLYTEADINAALGGGPAITAPDADGHGTNTMGVAAGNGRATGNGWPAERYVGMAPEADIIAVKIFPEPGDLSDCFTCYDISAGFDFIDAVAAGMGQPYVVNLSVGHHLGGHDGSDFDEMTIDSLVGPGISGKAVVKSAGNERGRPIHIGGTVTNGVTNSHTLTIPQYNALPGTFNDIVAWQVWYENGDSLTVSIADPTTAPCGGAATTLSASTGDGFRVLDSNSGTMIIDDSSSPAPNGARFFDMEVDDQLGTAPCRGTWTFRVHGDNITAGGRYDAWIWISTFGSGGQAPWTAPDNTRLISIPGTAFNGTTVAAYVTRQNWLSTDGVTYQYNLANGQPPPLGSLAVFSSPGPSRDGRLKPEIAAPGWTSLSALSQDAAPLEDPRTFAEDGKHWALVGTSFAAPHVAGIFAQLLGLNPNLDAAQLRALVMQTGRSDGHTGAVPNDSWGRGKVDARAAADLMLIANLTAGTDNQSFNASPTPTATTYNVYRGNLSLVSPGYFGTCFASGLASPSFSDVSNPAVGDGFFYYVTGVESGIEGTLGFSWDGAASMPRPNLFPCP